MGKQPVGEKWLLYMETKADGIFGRCKACLMARGFTQGAGDDFGETFAPVTGHTTIRLLLSVAACHCLHLHSLPESGTYSHPLLSKDPNVATVQCWKYVFASAH